MTAAMEQVDRKRAIGLISLAAGNKLTINDQHTLADCVSISQKVWTGANDGVLICAWGLIPPTLLSDRAYLWMYHTPALEEHKFIFVRKSQIAVEEMLKEYEKLIGHVLIANDSGKRWLKWLGAEMLDHEGPLLRFQIRRKNG